MESVTSCAFLSSSKGAEVGLECRLVSVCGAAIKAPEPGQLELVVLVLS